MRYLTIIFLLLSFIPLVGQEPLVYYRFENNWNDEMGNHNLIPKSSPTLTGTYKIEGFYAGWFVSGAQRAITNTTIDLSSTAWTITFWVRNGSASGNRVCWENRIPGTRQGIGVEYDATNQRIQVTMDAGASQDNAYSANSSLTSGSPPGNWVTLVKHNPADQYIGIYINGVKSGTDSIGLAGANRNDTISIGNTRTGGANISGGIDQFSVYLRALSQAEITDLYNHRTSNYYLTEEEPATSPFNTTLFYNSYFGSRIIPNYSPEPPELFYNGPDYSILSHDQRMLTYTGAGNGDIVGTFDPWYVTDYVRGTYSYTLTDSESGLYAINSSTGIITRTATGALTEGVDTLAVQCSVDGVIKTYNVFVKVVAQANCVFIDPSSGTNGTGTKASPYNTWAAISWTEGVTYLQKRGTTFNGGILCSGSGTANNPININAYGQGNRPRVTNNTGNGLIIQGNHYTLQEYEFYKCRGITGTGAGIRQQSSMGIFTNWFIADITLNSNNYRSDLGKMNGGQIYLIKPSTVPASDPWFTNSYYHVLEDIYATDDGTVDPDADSDEQYGIKVEGGDIRITNMYGYLNRSDAISSVGYSFDNIYEGILGIDNKITAVEMSGRNLILRESYLAIPNYGSRTIDVQDAGSRGILVEHCKLVGARYNGTSITGGFVISAINTGTWPGSAVPNGRAIIIRDNDISGAVQAGQTLSAIWIGYTVDSVAIYRNKIYGNTIGVTIGANGTTYDCDTSYTHNNIFWSNSSHDIRVLGGSKHYIYNNTGTGIISTVVPTGAVRGNIYGAMSSSSPASNNLDIDGIIQSDYFEDYTNHDYHLKVTAVSAIDYGYDWGQEYDFDGVGMTGSGWDIGAYEYAP